ncbi:MAG: hypothetical protein IJS13_00705 [Paludibacteraceae bacterium]|nr:hypothetical protein [Paludibacteraceae bacterium]
MDLQKAEIAYSFFHQKLRVYEHSSLSWQRDDIEVAISDYVGMMDKALYRTIAGTTPDYLLNHTRFEADLRSAVAQLERFIFR